MSTYTASHEGRTYTRNSRRVVTHVTLHTHPEDETGKVITSWHGSEKAARRGDTTMRSYGWEIIAVLPVAIAD
jgi:hypothetical protein